MKFARDFRASLASQGFPPRWTERAIPYRQLKKCLKKVERELLDLGLDPKTLRALLESSPDDPVALQYKLDVSSDSNSVRPRLTVYVRLRDGVVIDACLTPASRRFVEKIASELPHGRRMSLAETIGNGQSGADATISAPVAPDSSSSVQPADLPLSPPLDSDVAATNYDEVVELPLSLDGEFFGRLQDHVGNLDALQAEEQENLASEVVQLGKEVSAVAKPSRFSKSDLARWRTIFELYLDAEIFFATHERAHGARTSQSALKQLQWFQSEVDKQSLARHFKLPESQQAFTRFINLNATLLKNLQFQELNKLAVAKILKKFDKRTSLNISKDFPVALNSDKLLAGNIAQDVCATMSKELVAVVPQLSDYLCPVCFAVAYRPVRLDCQHVFCIRCILKIQQRGEKHCPLCRADVVMNATEDHLDRQLEKYLRKYFAKEVKEKQRANEIERGIEDFGPGYTHHECVIL